MSSSPVIVYRALDTNGDPIWGQGQYNLLSNTDAVAQLILTRLRLFEGEWWANTLEGLPLWQSILAVTANVEDIVLLIRNRVLGTPYVVDMINVEAGFNSSTRAFSFSAVALTQFGTNVQITFPTPPSQGLPL